MSEWINVKDKLPELYCLDDAFGNEINVSDVVLTNKGYLPISMNIGR